jgi:hypothetical protein
MASSLEAFVDADDHSGFSRASNRALKVIHTFVNKEDSIDLLYASLDSN